MGQQSLALLLLPQRYEERNKSTASEQVASLELLGLDNAEGVYTPGITLNLTLLSAT
jgi:hypothetical protein